VGMNVLPSRIPLGPRGEGCAMVLSAVEFGHEQGVLVLFIVVMVLVALAGFWRS
jgi:hypothetical protein